MTRSIYFNYGFAAGLRFELRCADSESAILPLDDPAIYLKCTEIIPEEIS